MKVVATLSSDTGVHSGMSWCHQSLKDKLHWLPSHEPLGREQRSSLAEATRRQAVGTWLQGKSPHCSSTDSHRLSWLHFGSEEAED